MPTLPLARYPPGPRSRSRRCSPPALHRPRRYQSLRRQQVQPSVHAESKLIFGKEFVFYNLKKGLVLVLTKL